MLLQVNRRDSSLFSWCVNRYCRYFYYDMPLLPSIIACTQILTRQRWGSSKVTDRWHWQSKSQIWLDLRPSTVTSSKVMAFLIYTNSPMEIQIPVMYFFLVLIVQNPWKKSKKWRLYAQFHCQLWVWLRRVPAKDIDIHSIC